ncbi:MAG: type II toxin-antitoxin system prevent-host-death family antitoxin [Propionibacteriaceae bacterium]|nr:type II toxin-antitoxin system prevent-host-death family antitoxin [Propionibacteriaceae bacterium]
METLQREYTAREFNRDPSLISRAARRFGSVRVTNRGEPSLVVLDAARFPSLAEGGSPSLLQTLSSDADWDEDIVGEPPRLQLFLRSVDA